jgi:Trk-type K+ transport systems, membrane components
VTNSLRLRFRLYFAILLVVIVAGILGMIAFEHRSPLDSLYFVVVTIATVGFGDIHPETDAGKLLTIGIILVGVGCFVGLAASALDIMIEKRERDTRMRNLNMVIGVFFSETGTRLLRCFSAHDPTIGNIRSVLVVSDAWSDEDFTRAASALKAHSGTIDSRTIDLPKLERFLSANKGFLLTLFETPQILEHEDFTPLLQAVFHLAEELSARKSLAGLPASDYAHLSGDISRVYRLLVPEWLVYMRHLKKHYPYLFSLAMRTNPFDADASVIVRESPK